MSRSLIFVLLVLCGVALAGKSGSGKGNSGSSQTQSESSSSSSSSSSDRCESGYTFVEAGNNDFCYRVGSISTSEVGFLEAIERCNIDGAYICNAAQYGFFKQLEDLGQLDLDDAEYWASSPRSNDDLDDFLEIETSCNPQWCIDEDPADEEHSYMCCKNAGGQQQIQKRDTSSSSSASTSDRCPDGFNFQSGNELDPSWNGGVADFCWHPTHPQESDDIQHIDADRECMKLNARICTINQYGAIISQVKAVVEGDMLTDDQDPDSIYDRGYIDPIWCDDTCVNDCNTNCDDWGYFCCALAAGVPASASSSDVVQEESN